MTKLMLAAALAIFLVASAPPAKAADAPPDPKTLELARQLVDATGIKATLSAAFHDMVTQTYASMKPAATADAETRRKVFAEASADATAKMSPRIVDAMVDSYARNFTVQELSDLLAFYQSPTGRSMVAKTPQLMRGVTAELIGLMPQLRRDMGEEACAKITCTAAEKTAFFGSATAAAH